MLAEVQEELSADALPPVGPEHHSTAHDQKEALSDSRAALQITASSGSLSQKDLGSLARGPVQDLKPDTQALAPDTCSPSPDMHLSPAKAEGRAAVVEQPQGRGVASEGEVQQQKATSLVSATRVWRRPSEDSEESGYSSSPSSTASTLMLKPLTPAQSGEHRPHDIKERSEADATKPSASRLCTAAPGTSDVEGQSSDGPTELRWVTRRTLSQPVLLFTTTAFGWQLLQPRAPSSFFAAFERAMTLKPPMH